MAESRTTAHANVQGRCPACFSTSLFLGEGGHVTCSRLDCPNPTAADDQLHHPDPIECSHAAALAQLHAGEEDGYVEFAEPTPGQWLWKFNRVTPEQRLGAVRMLLGDAARGRTCFFMAHEARSRDDANAWVIVNRVRDVIDTMEDITGARHWARILRKVVGGEQPALTEAAESYPSIGLTGEATDTVAVLSEVLAAFRSVHDEATRTLVGYISAPIHPDDMDRWRAALSKEQP